MFIHKHSNLCIQQFGVKHYVLKNSILSELEIIKAVAHQAKGVVALQP